MDARRIPFTAEDERCIVSAGTWGMIVSMASIAMAAVSLVVHGRVLLRLPELLTNIFVGVPVAQALITMLTSVWLLQASLAFRKVALTDEADPAHLLAGFRNLRAYFRIQVISILLVLVGSVVMAIAAA
jgi:hypothetical protein